jgi:hypothetical protein
MSGKDFGEMWDIRVLSYQNEKRYAIFDLLHRRIF